MQRQPYLLRTRVQENFLAMFKISSDGLKLMPGNPSLIEAQAEVLYYARLAINAGMADTVVGGMDALLQNQPNLGTAWLIKSWAFQRINDTEQALDAAQKALEYAPYYAQSHSNLADLMVKLGRKDEAVEEYRKALQINPKYPDALKGLNEALAQ